MVIVYCENRIAPDKQEEYLEKVRATGVVEKSNQETGNISYELVCSAVEPGKMLIVERWESRKHMPGHLRSAHFAALSHTRVSNIVFMALMVLTAAVTVYNLVVC